MTPPRKALDAAERTAERARCRAIQVIIDTLADEEWFVQVRNWHHPEFAATDAWYRYLDGRDWDLQTMPHDAPDPCPSNGPRSTSITSDRRVA